MLFNSLEFLFIFLPVTLLVFFSAAKMTPRAAIPLLALASVFFYCWWDIRFLPVLVLSILFNYSMAKWISGALIRGKLILGVAIGINLAALFYYKYFDFSISSLNAALNLSLPLQKLELPLGISFFTFTQIAYLVDVYRRKADTSSPINYILFVTYFPHLIAGPILHHGQMMPQFKAPSLFRLNQTLFASGLIFLTIGLIKKVLVADQLARYATPVFSMGDAIAQMGAVEAWTGALSYTLQLYFDFSGYCDMAIGISLMFNIQLPLNFSSPYKAVNIIDFWRRWHMTLSQFLRDYLYIPLGGNRFGSYRRYLNLFLTMLLGGLWHGANWTFVIWGCLHGTYLVINHGFVALRNRLGLPALPKSISIFITFLAVVLAWVPFRASNMTEAINLWQAMLLTNGLAPDAHTLSGIHPSKAFGGIAAGILVVFLLPNSQELANKFKSYMEKSQPKDRLIWGVLGVLLGIAFGLTTMSIGHVSEFLYFQF